MSALTLPIQLYTEFPQIPLDFSWEVGLVDKFDRGEVSGRDFFFTYGPLTQVAYASSGLLRRATPLDRSGLSYATLLGATLLLLWASVAATPALGPAASAAVFLIFALLLNFSFDRWNLYLRGYATLAATLLLPIALTRTRTRDRWLWAGITGLGCFAAQLVSFDAGIFSLVSCIGAIGLGLALSLTGLAPTSGLSLRTAAGMAGALAATAFAANLLLPAVFWLTARDAISMTDYHYYNWHLASAYNAAFGAQWDLNPLLAVLLECALVYVVVTIVASWRRWTWEHQAFAICVGVLAVVSFKGAVVRSGQPKILISCLPLIYMAVVFVVGEQPVRRSKPAGIVLLAMLAVAWPFHNGVMALDKLVRAVEARAGIRAHWRPLFTHHVEAGAVVPDGVIRELAPGTKLLAFPYHNLLATALGREQITPTLQPYAAIDLDSQRHFVEHASRVRNETEVIYALDGAAAGEIDLVPNVTRSPVIFEYLQGQFAPKTGVLHAPGYVVMAPRGAPVSLPSRAVPFTTQHDGAALVVKLGQPAACALLKVATRIVYPITAALGRPTPLAVTVTDRGRLVRQQRLVTLAVNQSFETYIPLVAGEGFVRVLEWPNMRDPALDSIVVDALRLEPVALGRFDVMPSSVEMAKVECVALGGDSVVPVQPGSDTPIGPIVSGRPVRQEFVTRQEGLSGVSVRTATYARSNTGTVTFSVVALKDGREDVVYSVTKDASAVRDNEWFSVSFPSQATAGRRFAVVVATSQSAPEKAITLWYLAGNPYPDGDLTVGPTRVNGDLALQLHFTR